MGKKKKSVNHLKNRFTADFETTTTEDDCRVWAYALCSIENEDIKIGNNIEEFFDILQNKKENYIVYFHNLAFDGMFILYHLLRNGYEEIRGKETPRNHTFKILISNKMLWYSIEIFFEVNEHKTNKVTIYDSLKLLNFSVEKIGKDFDLKVKKLTLGKFNPKCIYKKKRIYNKENFKREEKREYLFFIERDDYEKNLGMYKKTRYSLNKFLGLNPKIIREKINIKYLNLGYKGYRKEGHVLTKIEKEYITNDVLVMSRALKELFNKGIIKMTIGSNALHEYKEKIVGRSSFEKFFPVLSFGEDKDIRQSYRGGFTYLEDRFKNCIVGDGIVLDFNSLYPYVMHEFKLPFGKPKFFEGEYVKDKIHPLYIQKFTCQFKLKEKHIPTIQCKNKDLNFNPTEYLKNSIRLDGIDKPVMLTLTSVDLNLFLSHYEVYNINYICGYKFKSSDKLFCEYIDKWSDIKIKSKNEGNGSMYSISKLMLNSLYGKFAKKTIMQSKYTIYDEFIDKLSFKDGEKEIKEGIYIPVATFITAWARYLTITSAQKVYDRFIYADTDSLHLTGREIPEDLNIHDTDLGALKNEFIFEKGKYLRQKSYMERGYEPNKPSNVYTKITCAGMPEKCYKRVRFESFKIGAKFKGKLQKRNVSGGAILKDIEFTIKENFYLN